VAAVDVLQVHLQVSDDELFHPHEHVQVLGLPLLRLDDAVEGQHRARERAPLPVPVRGSPVMRAPARRPRVAAVAPAEEGVDERAHEPVEVKRRARRVPRADLGAPQLGGYVRQQVDLVAALAEPDAQHLVAVGPARRAA